MTDRLPILKKHLWEIRIQRGIAEVKKLAVKHSGDLEYEINNAHDAFDVFTEHSSQGVYIYKASEQEGELVQDLFIHRWNNPFIVTPGQILLTGHALLAVGLFELLTPLSWRATLLGLLLIAAIAWRSKRILAGLAVLRRRVQGSTERKQDTEEEAV